MKNMETRQFNPENKENKEQITLTIFVLRFYFDL